jgi:CHAT domain-containing protein
LDLINLDWTRIDNLFQAPPMVVFDVLSRLQHDEPVPEPEKLSSLCLKFLVKMASEVPDCALATTETGRNYTSKLREELEARTSRSEILEAGPETIAALVPVIDNINTSMLHRSRVEIDAARASIEAAKAAQDALPTAVSRADAYAQDEHARMILGEEIALAKYNHDAETILFAQEARLTTSLRMSQSDRNRHVLLNDILSYVSDVALINPNKAILRLFPLIRELSALSPAWSRAVMASAKGALLHANGDNVGAMEAVSEMEAALGTTGFANLDTIAAQGLLDAIADLLETQRESTERTAMLGLLAVAFAQRTQIRAANSSDPDAEISRSLKVTSVFEAIQERATMIEQASQQAMAGYDAVPPAETPEPVSSFNPEDYSDFDAAIERSAMGEASTTLLAELEGYADALEGQPMLASRAFHAAATVAHNLGQADKGKAMHQKALQAAQLVGDLSFEAEVTLEMVFSEPGKATSDAARAVLHSFIERVEAARANLTTAYLPSNFLADKVMPYHLAIYGAAKAGDYAEMVQTMEYLKARQVLGKPLVHTSTNAKRQHMRALRQELCSTERGTTTQHHLEQQARLLWDELMIARDAHTVDFSLEALTARLGDTVVLSYFQLETNVFIACLISRDGVQIERILTGDHSDYEAAANVLRTMTHESLGNSAKFETVARVLLPAKFHAQLRAADQIVLSAHRQLHTLPIHALPFDGKALILHKPVVYVPNLSVLFLPLQDRPETERFFGAGTVNSLSKAGTPAAALPSAEREVAAVAEFYSEATTLLGEHVTVDALSGRSSAFEDASIAHLALHGENVAHPDLSRSPMDVYLCLADGTVDGIDLACVPLSARLVFMSACFGGKRAASLGELESLPGDALFGLQAALQMAGGRALVAPLWEADDTLTPEIARRFHESYAESASAAQSLHKAILDFVENPKRRIREKDPCKWAPFALTVFDSCVLKEEAVSE